MSHSEFYSESEWKGCQSEWKTIMIIIFVSCKICEKCDFFLKARFKIVVYVLEITELKNSTRTSLGLEKSPSRAKSLK